MTESGKIVYTVGTSTRSWEEFTSLLNAFSISTLVDVRRFPISRLDHFRREKLQKGLQDVGIRYVYLGKELGGFRDEGYESFSRTETFKRGIELLETEALQATTVIVCAEALPWKCHRLHVGKALFYRGWKVVHIIGIDKIWVI